MLDYGNQFILNKPSYPFLYSVQSKAFSNYLLYIFLQVQYLELYKAYILILKLHLKFYLLAQKLILVSYIKFVKLQFTYLIIIESE